ncbi:hypothetical protein ACYCSU_17275 [Paenibacillus sp. ALE1]
MLLQDKYIKNVLTFEECIEFLTYLKENIDAPFRENRIVTLERQIKKFQKRNKSTQKWEDGHLQAAIEYGELTEKWLSQEANWRGLGSSITKWFYDDNCFFTWFSGVDSVEHLDNARKADEELQKLIKSKSK